MTGTGVHVCAPCGVPGQQANATAGSGAPDKYVGGLVVPQWMGSWLRVRRPALTPCPPPSAPRAAVPAQVRRNMCSRCDTPFFPGVTCSTGAKVPRQRRAPPATAGSSAGQQKARHNIWTAIDQHKKRASVASQAKVKAPKGDQLVRRARARVCVWLCVRRLPGCSVSEPSSSSMCHRCSVAIAGAAVCVRAQDAGATGCAAATVAPQSAPAPTQGGSRSCQRRGCQ